MFDLSGKRVVITRPRLQAAGFSGSLRAAGADPILFPVIEIGPVSDTTVLDRALQKLECYEWLILTSANGVEAVWNRIDALRLAGMPPDLSIAAIGPKTAEALQSHGIHPDFVPGEFIAEAILPGLGDLRGRWALLPRADQARPALAQAIAAAGGVAHEITAYRTLPAQPDPDGLRALSLGVDIITFTSSSTVRNFTALVASAGLDAHNLPGNPIFACIGPITAATAREEGFPVSVIAGTYTTEGLLQALIESVKSS